MSNINSLIIEGKVTEVKQKGNHTMDFVVSVTRNIDETRTEETLVECTACGMLSRISLYEGNEVRIVGRLKKVTYTEDGRKHAKLVVLAEHIEKRMAHND